MIRVNEPAVPAEILPDTGGRQGELETEPIFAKRLEGLVAEAGLEPATFGL